MIPLQVTVQYIRAGIKESRRVKLLMDVTVRDAVQIMLKELDLKPEVPDQEYRLLRQRQVLRSETRLFEAGVQEGDILQLVAYDANATTMGRIISSNVLSRMGSKASDEPLPVKASLVGKDGVVFELRRIRAMIGRADAKLGYPPESLDADLTALDPFKTVSRPHALIVFLSGTFTIRDLYSQLGVLINGQRVPVNTSQPLHDGDRISFGDVELVFQFKP